MSRHLRQQIVQEAARLMVNENISSIALAKKKALKKFGISKKSLTPDNLEIEMAVTQYQQLFRPEQSHFIQQQLKTALQAMKMLESFSPRLVGSVLKGIANPYDAISIHVFTDTTEKVFDRLTEYGIPYDLAEHNYQLDRKREIACPTCRFLAGDSEIAIAIFPQKNIRQSPLSPIDDKPMRRADLATVRKLLDNDPEIA